MKDNRGFINYRCGGVLCAPLPAKQREIVKKADAVCENCYYIEMTGGPCTVENAARHS
jgi:hypothetical protein